MAQFNTHIQADLRVLERRAQDNYQYAPYEGRTESLPESYFKKDKWVMGTIWRTYIFHQDTWHYKYSVNLQEFREIIEIPMLSSNGVLQNISNNDPKQIITSIFEDIETLANDYKGVAIEVGFTTTIEKDNIIRAYIFTSDGWQYKNSKTTIKYDETQEQFLITTTADFPNRVNGSSNLSELKKACKTFGLKSTGTKDDLWQRLQNQYIDNIISSL